MLHLPSDDGYHPPLDGVERKTLAHGERTTLVEFRLAAGSEIPGHRHSHEQTGYLVTGVLDFTIGGTTHRAVPGSSWSIPGGVEHGVVALEDCVVIEVFSPVREEYH